MFIIKHQRDNSKQQKSKVGLILKKKILGLLQTIEWIDTAHSQIFQNACAITKYRKPEEWFDFGVRSTLS